MSDAKEVAFGEEWNLGYVRKKLSELPTALEPVSVATPDGYEKAASVLAYFDPNELQPVPGEISTNKAQLLTNSSVVSDAKGQPRSMLRSERRRAALEKLGLDGIRRASSVNARPDTPIQKMMDGYIFGRAPELDQQTPPELAATLQVTEWLSGLVGGLPAITEIQRRVELESLLRPFRVLAGRAFSGRRKELDLLREYVGFLQSQSLLESVARGARGLLNWHEKPPLVVYGPGGMGKSALIARFILDHLVAGTDMPEALPFVYLDFDRASLVPERPVTLLLESGRQLAIQFPEIKEQWNALQPEWRRELLSRRSAPRSIRDAVVGFRKLLDDSGLTRRPLLFVLDTFEEVQYRSRDFVEEVFTFLSVVQEAVPRLRVVVAGRAVVSLDKYPTDNHLLQPLDTSDAAMFLEQRGLNKEIAIRVAEQVGGNPLSLRLALDVIGREGVGRRGIEGLETRNRLYIRLQDSRIQGQLYRRILGHVHSSDIVNLAHPGLVLRRITPELILEVLAEPCGVSVPNLDAARALFTEMQREVSLVTVAEDGSLRHLPEVRRIMIDLLRKDDPAKVKQIQELAISYYRRLPDLASRAEALYHMLAMDYPLRELEVAWSSGMEVFLGGALEEIPPRARAWLGLRLGLDIDEKALGSSDLEDWERYAYQRARNLLQLGKPDLAIEVMRERETRSFGSSLLVPQAQAQVLTHDFVGARATIAVGMREVQDPAALLKFYVMTSWIDSLTLKNLDGREVIGELLQIARRFVDDPRVIRFGLNRLDLVHDNWFLKNGAGILAETVNRLPDTRLTAYPLLASDLAVCLGVDHLQILLRLAKLVDLSTGVGAAAEKLVNALNQWDKDTDILARYRISTSSLNFALLVSNLALISKREGVRSEVAAALVECFREKAQTRSDQILYQEMEVEQGVVNRYFNPPDRVHRIGRQLYGRGFFDLTSQVQSGEVLLGLYRNQVGALVATHLDSESRMNEMEALWAPSEGYYAVDRFEANRGLDNKIPVEDGDV